MCFYCCIHPEVDRILDVQTYADVNPCYPSELFFLKCSYSTPGITPLRRLVGGQGDPCFFSGPSSHCGRELSKTLRALGGKQLEQPLVSGWWFGTCLFSIIYGMSSFPLTSSYFSRWTRCVCSPRKWTCTANGMKIYYPKITIICITYCNMIWYGIIFDKMIWDETIIWYIYKLKCGYCMGISSNESGYSLGWWWTTAAAAQRSVQLNRLKSGGLGSLSTLRNTDVMMVLWYVMMVFATSKYKHTGIAICNHDIEPDKLWRPHGDITRNDTCDKCIQMRLVNC